ncbi:exonuclease subunit SbcD [Oleispira antarctica]|uniref:Nuclease SbcCD subunit D n=1 Tax=Oleispira antarctica TaxID=188908 RepID=A0A1Y5HS58_OLEAN|nr:exonuclease subunit SbcD [Oleispira antarctica]
MRILHTSDWHLGQFFINKSRAAEHQKFIQWLFEQVEVQKVDAVIIAGDIFDTGAPPSYARELYNQFVIGMHQLGCQVVILAGNHDSVSTLNESKNILAQLNARVISSANPSCDEQILMLNNRQGDVGAILCAIPYIRPRDVVKSQADESGVEKQQALGQAIRDHYLQLFELAKEKQKKLENPVAIIATGHLTALGVKSSESVRDIYIGNLEAFPASSFPPADYIALGHIHRPQIVAKSDHIRYCGSPIPLSFDELGSPKQVLVVEFKQAKLVKITPLIVPLFQPMKVIKGDLESIEQQLLALDKTQADGNNELPIWLSIEVETQDYLNDLQARVQQISAKMNVEILQLRRARKQQQQQIERTNNEVLAELTPEDVFKRRLEQEDFNTPSEEQRKQRLMALFNKTVSQVTDEN